LVVEIKFEMKSFGQLLANSSGILCHLSHHSQTLKQVEKIFKESLPSPLNRHCHIANLREQTLVVNTDSSLWATRLRYIIPELKQRWRQNRLMPIINQVIVQVRPPL
jgi:hypothetical protein